MENVREIVRKLSKDIFEEFYKLFLDLKLIGMIRYGFWKRVYWGCIGERLEVDEIINREIN